MLYCKFQNRWSEFDMARQNTLKEPTAQNLYKHKANTFHTLIHTWSQDYIYLNREQTSFR